MLLEKTIGTTGITKLDHGGPFLGLEEDVFDLAAGGGHAGQLGLVHADRQVLDQHLQHRTQRSIGSGRRRRLLLRRRGAVVADRDGGEGGAGVVGYLAAAPPTARPAPPPRAREPGGVGRGAGVSRGRGGVDQRDGAEVAVALAIELRHGGLLPGLRSGVMMLLMLLMMLLVLMLMLLLLMLLMMMWLMWLMWLVLCVVVLSSVVVGLRLTGSTSAVVLLRLLTEMLPLRRRLLVLVTVVWPLCWWFIE